MAAKDDDARVFVGGLPSSTKAHHLAQAFCRFGTLLQIQMAMDRKTGRLRRFGFITFTNAHDARAAILHMHNTELHGHTITVSHAFPRISSYDEYNHIQDNNGTSGKHIYINNTSRNYSNNKNHISDFIPYEDCYKGNEANRWQLSQMFPLLHPS